VPASDDFDVRLVAAGEAASLIALIRRCYGETYIDPAFYDESAVRTRLAGGQLHSIGAFAARRELVAHMAISLRAHGGITADAGMTLVDPAYRGRGLARSVAVGLARHATALGLVGVHDYPVTVHAATQRLGAGIGIDTGLLLANVPADVAFQAMQTSAPGSRSSSLMRWLPFGSVPERSVFLPDRYRGRLAALYADAAMPRAVLDDGAPGGSQSTRLAAAFDARRRLLRIAVERVGDDLAARVASETRAAARRGAVVAHVDLPLADARVSTAVEDLRAGGFSFAGLLPEYRDGDVLRLQWLADSIADTGASILSSEATREIAAFVIEDRAAVLADRGRHPGIEA
jgi:serine/threonine-protein kinase RsbW